MRLVMIAAAGASASADPTIGERDAELWRERFVLPDLDCEVRVLDPAVDLAEQIDTVLAETAGRLDELLFYASCLLAVVDETDCFLCLDPSQPEVGDALRDLCSAMSGRAARATLVVVDARYDDPNADVRTVASVLGAIERCVDPPGTGIELMAAVRPRDAHIERIPSRLSASLLEAIDEIQGPLSAEQIYALARAGTDFGRWPHAVNYRPGRAAFAIRPGLQPLDTPAPTPPMVEAVAVESPVEAPPPPPAPPPAPAAPSGGYGPPPEPPPPAGFAAIPPPPPAPEPPPPGSMRGRKSEPRRPPPPSEKVESHTVTLPARRRPRQVSERRLPKVIVAGAVSDKPPEPVAPPLVVDEPAPVSVPIPAAPLAPSPTPVAAAVPVAPWDPTVTPPTPVSMPAEVMVAAQQAWAQADAFEPAMDPARAPRPASEDGHDLALDDSALVSMRPADFDDVAGAGGAFAHAPPPVPKKKSAAELTVEDHVKAGDTHHAAGFVDKALGEYKKALGKLGTATTPERAEIYVRIGELMRKTGKARVAISNFDKALAILPSHTRALGAVIELNADEGNWRAVQQAEDKFFAGLEPADPKRIDYLLASGDRWRERGREPAKAKERYLAARDAAPKATEPLRRLLAVYEAEKSLDHVLDTRRRLAALVAEPRDRARVYFELGEYCMKISREDEAVAAFELALDSDPTMLEALEVLATALAEGQEWGELERVYQKMIATFRERARSAEIDVVIAELYHRLALLYRDHLEDPASALRALDKELAIRPQVLATQLMAAELAIEIEDPATALTKLRTAAQLEPRRADTYHQIFALAQRYDEPDTAFLAASAAQALAAADEREAIVYREHKVDGVPGHVNPLGLGGWDWLRDAERDAAVDQVMRAVATPILRLRVRQLEADGKLPELSEAERQDPDKSTISVVRSLKWASHFLGVPLPAIYLAEDRAGTLFTPFAKHQATLLGRDVLRGRSLAELAFLAGRHLALRLPEHELCAHLSSIDELSACFLAACKLVLGEVPATGDLAAAAETLALLLQKSQTPEETETLYYAVKEFAKQSGRANLLAWVKSVERCATRAGLIMCGDLDTAVSLLRGEEAHGFATAEERIDDLFSFCLSGSHLKLRQTLGSSLS